MWAGGEGAYGALDAVGGKEIGTVLDSIRASGRVFLYGALGGPEVSYNVLKVIYEVRQCLADRCSRRFAAKVSCASRTLCLHCGCFSSALQSRWDADSLAFCHNTGYTPSRLSNTLFCKFLVGN